MKNGLKTRRFKKLSSVGLVLLSSAAIVGMAASCGETSIQATHEFVFTGETEIGEETYNLVLTGDDNVFDLEIKELPALGLDGTYALVEEKGYKIYFNDSVDSLAYTKFNNQTKEFSFKYLLDLGAQYGTGTVLFKYASPDFKYDGVGLGIAPPTFKGAGAGEVYGRPVAFNATLASSEDGTCSLTTDVFIITNRSGAYTYDIGTNVFTFELTPQGDAETTTYVSTFDSATDTFSVEVEVSSSYFKGIPAKVTVSFTE